MTLNKAQLEAVVELAQEGHTEPALALAQAYHERFATPRILAYAQALLQSLLAKAWGPGMEHFWSRFAKNMYGHELTKEELDEAKQRTKRIMKASVAVMALSAVLVFLFLMLNSPGKQEIAREMLLRQLGKARYNLYKALKVLNHAVKRISDDVVAQEN
jgi:hypothetical protein